ncbi:hypothetical protein CC78DRAFT_574625 [Lojkania enalia]|uniref:Uncharacterized protein n=1 Tax=Lojkania enalia TaxID=147567 RepID=A0A9P4NAQ6_9PLEO|nr:hypothetical protein CC78DRAFT_574625 [Didymosphaeria enalia]
MVGASNKGAGRMQQHRRSLRFTPEQHDCSTSSYPTVDSSGYWYDRSFISEPTPSRRQSSMTSAGSKRMSKRGHARQAQYSYKCTWSVRCILTKLFLLYLSTLLLAYILISLESVICDIVPSHSLTICPKYTVNDQSPKVNSSVPSYCNSSRLGASLRMLGLCKSEDRKFNTTDDIAAAQDILDARKEIQLASKYAIEAGNHMQVVQRTSVDIVSSLKIRIKYSDLEDKKELLSSIQQIQDALKSAIQSKHSFVSRAESLPGLATSSLHHLLTSLKGLDGARRPGALQKYIRKYILCYLSPFSVPPESKEQALVNSLALESSTLLRILGKALDKAGRAHYDMAQLSTAIEQRSASIGDVKATRRSNILISAFERVAPFYDNISRAEHIVAVEWMEKIGTMAGMALERIIGAFRHLEIAKEKLERVERGFGEGFDIEDGKLSEVIRMVEDAITQKKDDV